MVTLPTGTVTFLFTDIEGSTSRWEDNPEAMQVALARHDQLLREIILAHAGSVFKTIGDAFCAAFSTAQEALAAACAAQRALHAEDWCLAEPLRVRMALHTGAAEERDGDYFGPPLNRVARLLSAGHGGQILLSCVVQELIRDQLPTGTELRDLGEHRLKDLIRPEHIFQLVIFHLPSDFAALKTLDHRPTNLPVQPTLFIGREKEVATAQKLLLQQNVRLLVLTGPGGTGKTRLSLQVAAEVSDHFEHGIFFVALAAITDPLLVAPAIAQTIGVKEAAGQSAVQSLQSYLANKQMLLVLDNFEQIIEASTMVADIMAAAPQVRMLVTSRETLHIYGEQEFPVPPLALPNLRQPPPLDVLSQYAAIALFIARAQAVKPDFTITNENAPAVAEICVRLDGLPLAIELAAARIKLLAPQAMLTRLTSRLKLLTGGARNLPARQQTLRGAIDWSYDLLVENERTLFRRLAIFSGGCTLSAVEAVCNAEGDLDLDMLDGISSLCDKSLLRREADDLDEPRFRMLELVHEYAVARLAVSGAIETIRQQHASYYLELAETAEPELLGPQQHVWLDRLELDHDNLRVALTWLVEQEMYTEVLRLSGALWRFWYAHAHLSEGRRCLETIIACSPVTSTGLYAKVLNGAGIMAWMQGDYVAARSWLEQSHVIQRELGEKRGIAISLNNLGLVTTDQGDYTSARALYEESLTLLRELRDQWGTGLALSNLGNVARLQGDHAAAQQFNEECLSIWRKVGDKWGIATALSHLGYLRHVQQDNTRARLLYQESLALRRELSDKEGMAECFEGLAWVFKTDGDLIHAARLCHVAILLREAIGAPLSPADRDVFDQIVDALRQEISDTTFTAIGLEFARMSPEQALASVLLQGSPWVTGETSLVVMGDRAGR